ncbi:MAG TPA: IMP dehydrogenase [Candidatus Paceibacterota bacterium]
MAKKLPIDKFFESLNKEHIALTYGDVRLVPQHSNYMPHEVNIGGRITKNVSLQSPVISAAMDTVTELKMAIAMALGGGLGVIHRNLSIEEQVKQITGVKRYMNGMIPGPVCLKETNTVYEVREMMSEKQFSFESFPVINEEGTLRGIVTGHNFKFAENDEMIKSIMTKKVISGKQSTSIKEAEKIMRGHRIQCLPIASSKNKVTGMYVWSDVQRILGGNREGYNLDKSGRLRVGAAIGANQNDLERACELVKAGVDILVIDTAHGDTDNVFKILREVKKRFGKTDVLVGNVSTAEAAKRLVKAGADGIKIGQGPGSICTTRIVAGIGVPQVTAVYECVQALRGTNVPVCADGGITAPGDITIALALGAESVMLGSMIAGCNEAPGEIFITPDGERLKRYRGMGSPGALKASVASRERYGHKEKSKATPEGVEGAVKAVGPLSEKMSYLIGGLRAGMGYNGAKNLKELREKAELIRITSAGMSESAPHDLEIITATH